MSSNFAAQRTTQTPHTIKARKIFDLLKPSLRDFLALIPENPQSLAIAAADLTVWLTNHLQYIQTSDNQLYR